MLGSQSVYIFKVNATNATKATSASHPVGLKVQELMKSVFQGTFLLDFSASRKGGLNEKRRRDIAANKTSLPCLSANQGFSLSFSFRRKQVGHRCIKQQCRAIKVPETAGRNPQPLYLSFFSSLSLSNLISSFFQLSHPLLPSSFVFRLSSFASSEGTSSTPPDLQKNTFPSKKQPHFSSPLKWYQRPTPRAASFLKPTLRSHRKKITPFERLLSSPPPPLFTDSDCICLPLIGVLPSFLPFCTWSWLLTVIICSQFA